MSRQSRLIALLAALPLLACAPQPRPPAQTVVQAPGPTPADIERALQELLHYPDIDGRTVGAAPDAKVTAVVIFASWCGHCRTELAVFGELIRTHSRLRVIGVNHFERDINTLRAYLRQNAPWLQVVSADGPLIESLGAPRFVPTLFLFDARGRLVSAYFPPRRQPPTPDELRLRIAQLMAAG
jgi:thiol-disulfide isomerase/thioredoxin